MGAKPSALPNSSISAIEAETSKKAFLDRLEAEKQKLNALNDNIKSNSDTNSTLHLQNQDGKGESNFEKKELTHTELSLLVNFIFNFSTSKISALNFFVITSPYEYDSKRTHIFLNLDLLKIEPSSFMNYAEDILLAGIKFFKLSISPNAIYWLTNCFTNCQSKNIKANITVHNQLTNLCTKLNISENDMLIAIQQLITNYSVLFFQVFDYFEIEDSNKNDTQFLCDILRNIYSSGIPQIIIFTSNILEICLQNDDNKHTTNLLNTFLDTLDKKLAERSMINVELETVYTLNRFLSSKLIPLLENENINQLNSNNSGWKTQFSYIFGHLLRLNPMDEVYFSENLNLSYRLRNFPNMAEKPLNVDVILSTRKILQENIKEATSIVTSLCRTKNKKNLLTWFSHLMSTNMPSVRQQFIYTTYNTNNPTLNNFLLKIKDFSDTGFLLNAFWVLIKLIQPISVSKLNLIDPYYLLTRDAKTLMHNFINEACYADLEETELMNISHRENPAKFSTEIFFLALRAMHDIFCPALKEFQFLLELLNDSYQSLKDFKPEAKEKYNILLGKMLCFATLVFDSVFLKDWWSFCNLILHYIAHNLCKALPNSNNFSLNMSEKINMIDSSVFKECPSNLKKFPLCCYDDMIDATKLMLALSSEDLLNRRNFMKNSVLESLLFLDAELLTALSLFYMRSNNIIRNPHSRLSSGFQLILQICTHSSYARLSNTNGIIKWSIPSLIGSFIDAQKTGYYDKMNQRLLIIRLFEHLLQYSSHKSRLSSFIQDLSNKEVVLRFFAMYVESMTWVLDEGMSALAEIKKRELLKITNKVDQSDDRSQRFQESNDLNIENGQEVSSMPINELKKLAKTLLEAGLKSVKLMVLFSEICCNFISKNSILLSQTVTSLDCSLNNLVGPRCLQLKVSNFEELNFEPRNLLASICRVYINLNKNNQHETNLLSSICNDSRYFDILIFKKAQTIVRREGILNKDEISAFYNLVQLLQKESMDYKKEEDWLSKIWDDIPEEFKDPIMDELMINPVLLPTSGNIMDRKNIERHLLTEEFDPFNRMPLKISNLIPADELKKKIEFFILQKRSQIE